MRKIRKDLLEVAKKERPKGYVEDVLENIHHEDDLHIYIECKTFMRLRAKWTPNRGPGSWMHKIVGWLGHKANPGCSCMEHMVQMNIWGSAKCWKERTRIEAWIAKEAKRRSVRYPFKFGYLLLVASITASCAESLFCRK